MQLSVLTYNIDGVLDLDRVADVIAGSGAELVALQEVDRHRREQSAFADQPGHLAGRLGMHLAYAACLDDEPAHPGAPRAQYGTAFLSTRPLEDVSTTLLPCFPGSEQRGLLEATVDVGGTRLRVLGTHLQWDSETERTRLDEQLQALEALRDKLDSCIGCGCLSLKQCTISNPADRAAYSAEAPGAAYLPALLRRPPH